MLAASGPRAARAATLEYLDGTTIECKVLSKDDQTVTIETTMGGMTVNKTIPLASVHRVTINDKTYVITPRTAGATQAPDASPAAKTSPQAAGKTTRTRAEVEELINRLGRTPPDWFAATPLNYPKSLDLSWPIRAPEGGWNNQKNVGQYIWDIINPNPGKWKEGVKLLHHLLALDKDDPEKRTRDMEALGRMYHNLHQDYARAAFWWRQAGIDKSHSPPGAAVHLAECYWRLGNKAMAVEQLRKMRSVPYDAIKLWADMGETQQALAIANSAIRAGGQLHFAYLYAGDACRIAGRYGEAVKYYEQAAEVATGDNAHVKRCKERALASIEAIKLFELSDVNKVADGTYRASSIGYEGLVHVEVVVAGQRIESVRVVQHKEKQFYAAMTDTPAKILARQSVKGVDATSSATITSEAIINAAAKALAQGAK
jgi:uncharacterized protein with FMN-binding domain